MRALAFVAVLCPVATAFLHHQPPGLIASGRALRRTCCDVSPHGLALGPVSKIKRTGLISLRSADEQAGDPENPAMLSLPVAFVQGEKGKRGGFRVDYSNLLAGINWASDRAARDGVLMQQIEFPFDAEDQGSTLVKRFEALVSLSEKLAELMGLEGVVAVGERVQILDNINPGGGGEYLDLEGIFGVRGRIPGWPGDVLILMLAGVDTSDLEGLDKMVYEQGNGGLGASQESRILLFNTNLDRITSNKGLFGFGGASPFLTAFQPVYVAKQIGTGFLFQHHGMSPGWSLWGLPANQPEAECACVGAIGKKPAPGEAEAAIKASCRS